MPVPNCFSTMKARFSFLGMIFCRRTGPKTPSEPGWLVGVDGFTDHRRRRARTDGAGGQDGKEEADSQADIVVALGGVAFGGRALLLVASYAVPVRGSDVPGERRGLHVERGRVLLDAGMEMAVLVGTGVALAAVVVVVVVAAGLGAVSLGVDLDVLAVRANAEPGSTVT